MYLDFKAVVFAIPVQEQKIGTSLDRIRMASHQGGARIVFDSGLATDMFSYTIEPTAEGLEIVIQEAPAQVLEAGNKKRATPPKVSTTGDDKVIAPEGVTAEKKGRTDGTPAVAKIAKPAPADVFTLAGYEKQPITVDFYKIDLHNVFRLFGEISGLNIVVDEGVSGSLTLSLNNVPWDFALDIILNLKDLQKEERFNTIVISPKSKAFSWPERELDLLAVSADGTLTTVESLSVQKKIETPPEVVEAKKLMKMGREAEKEGDFSQALKHYEAAFALWSENGQLASRMASLFLARQGMNAKALHYAKAALGINKHDRNAALFAAISLANMKKTSAAKEYFDQAVSEEGGVKPAKEALTSYAIFNEENKNYVEALLLLARHEQLYGDSFETMVAKARIYDKEGSPERALAEYRAILLSGYELPPDLDRFIKGRLAMEKTR
jgi:type IV pilus assembly protein PilQ